ncbi:MAG: TRAP transporter small permease [Myxococcaceae bacterium]|nr:TRAP transporter small permease [Myxococcaceae bacterium]
MQPLFRFFSAVDNAIYRVERWLCLSLLGAMCVAVFLDVVHRVWSTEGKIDKLFASVFSPSVAPWLALAFYAAVSTALIFAAFRTRKSTSHYSSGRTWAFSLAITAGIGLFIRTFLWLAPNGLVWAQTFALCAMLWVGFLGASMAAHGNSHLTLEIMEFVWKGKVKANIGRAGALAAAAFTGTLGYLCFLHVVFHYRGFVESDGVSGRFEGFEAPRYVVYAVLPLTMWLMTLRYVGHAISPPPEPTHEDLAKKLDPLEPA